jgi:hypothetical protein
MFGGYFNPVKSLKKHDIRSPVEQGGPLFLNLRPG